MCVAPHPSEPSFWQSHALNSLLRAWTRGVEENVVWHHHLRNEETEVLGRAGTCLDQLELEPRSLSTETNASFADFWLEQLPQWLRVSPHPAPQQGRMPVKTRKGQGLPSAPVSPMETPMVLYARLSKRMWYFLP